MEDPVTVQTTLAELEKRHTDLESEIADALRHKSTDDLVIVELKRQKLHIKEKIERVRNAATPE